MAAALVTFLFAVEVFRESKFDKQQEKSLNILEEML